MQKQIIREKIFQKRYDGIITGFKMSDLPTNILPTDIIDVEKVDEFYSENNSWEAHTNLTVYREREENDVEFNKRKSFWEKKLEQSKKDRFEQYKKLKEEFESQV